jgi:hypothetical protein
MAAMLAQSLLVLSLVVRVYDAYGVPTENLAKARQTVDRILKDADVSLTWRLCPCPEPVGPGDLVMRVLAAPSRTLEPGSLGFSYVDLQRKSGTLATVFVDRVHVLAAAGGVDDGELLGRAMAHEVAHLLLGTHDHEHWGLMRGQWSTSDLAKQAPGEWRLLPGERARIRKAVARRLIESTVPAALTADADPKSDVNVQ